MARLRMCVLVLSLICLCESVLGDRGWEAQQEQHLLRSKRGIFSALGSLVGLSRPTCGNTDSCPLHHCRIDDAVVHGYCCGCARHSDRVPVNCPHWLQCPASNHPLCDDYNYMMDCCC